MAKPLDVYQTLCDLYRAHNQGLPDYAEKDIRTLATFAHGLYQTSKQTKTLEEELREEEKENIHSKRAGVLRAMKSLHDWIISPTKENLILALENMEETNAEMFRGIYVSWDRYSPVLQDFGPILLKHQLSYKIEFNANKEEIKEITQKIFSYPSKELQDDALTKLAEWQKRTNA